MNIVKKKPSPAPRKGVRVNYGDIPTLLPWMYKNEPVSESTHLYATETLDGKNWVSFPTLFQNPDGSWVDMSKGDWYKAYEEAKKRGEVIDFGENKEEAIRFGEGSWKDE